AGSPIFCNQPCGFQLGHRPAAVAYIHNLAMAGEYIQKQEAPALPEIARLDELKGQGQLIAITELELLHIHRLMGRMVLTNKIFNRYELYKVSKALGSRFGGEMLDIRWGKAVVMPTNSSIWNR
ncbi:MAG: hypothetical protein IBX50_13560, partial [Marinospirillum sp.]|uniref:hypothetical protein n=1 Tax=Marinospirillum sp. TaxID=2183934 RepID=UPI0019EA50D0